MTYPAFSIVIPTYQRKDAVCDAARALAKVKYRGSFEIIVVVDGSTDGTADALARLQSPVQLRVIEQANGGQASARNRGAAEATGDIILFVDDDLICEPDILEEHARMHRQGADAVTGEIPLHPESERGLVTDALAKAAAWERKPPVSAFHVYGGHLSIRKRAFEELGGFDQSFCDGGYGGDDLDFGLRLVGRYDVRHNKAAIAWQKSDIGPRKHMRRARHLAESDLRLIAKHPEVTAELLASRGAPCPGKPSLLFRLSRVPLLAEIAAPVAAWSAELARRTGLRSNATLARFYFAARSLSYWSAVRKAAGTATLRRWLGL
jgi:glycosyltransferase involved in cell wall biosynthesis